jgi:hypothetical protein
MMIGRRKPVSDSDDMRTKTVKLEKYSKCFRVVESSLDDDIDNKLRVK